MTASFRICCLRLGLMIGAVAFCLWAWTMLARLVF